ncbi:hypothetical protein [Allorhizocola rhizosphaerae]|uniref:hypothetical protein n=1 Tax=Allorhizocola rhizosphaerae TaxID=1872709 RepID=UPI000E3ECD25|nr:hypothetical protein [Allorhizocola rhizosphaerae]
MARLHRPLIVTAFAMTGLILVTLAGLVFDDRVLMGVPIWIKPLKFSISIVFYTVTLAWLISLINTRTAHRLGTFISVALFVEMMVIVGQVVRGRMSHFNAETSLDFTLFIIMGTTILLVWAATLWIAVLLLIQRVADRPTALAVRAGIFIALAGLATGFLMTQPTPTQLAALQSGQRVTVVGAHGVGVADGGPGLPLVNWSTEGGDLRVAHFIGMHALQALPLLALLLVYASRRWARLRDEGVRTRLVAFAAVAHGGLTLLVTWQALRGQALATPDALTLAAAGVLAVVVLAGTVWAVKA